LGAVVVHSPELTGQIEQCKNLWTKYIWHKSWITISLWPREAG